MGKQKFRTVSGFEPNKKRRILLQSILTALPRNLSGQDLYRENLKQRS